MFEPSASFPMTRPPSGSAYARFRHGGLTSGSRGRSRAVERLERDQPEALAAGAALVEVAARDERDPPRRPRPGRAAISAASRGIRPAGPVRLLRYGTWPEWLPRETRTQPVARTHLSWQSRHLQPWKCPCELARTQVLPSGSTRTNAPSQSSRWKPG